MDSNLNEMNVDVFMNIENEFYYGSTEDYEEKFSTSINDPKIGFFMINR